jgi:hypothetical protein
VPPFGPPLGSTRKRILLLERRYWLTHEPQNRLHNTCLLTAGPTSPANSYDAGQNVVQPQVHYFDGSQ